MTTKKKPAAKKATKAKKVGRPRKNLTSEQVEQLEKLAAVLTMEQIGDFLGISDDTLRRRMKEDKKILRAYARGRARAVGNVAKNLIQQASEGNVNAMKFYLETQAGWKVTQGVEHTGANGAPLEVVVRRTIIHGDH